MMLIVELLAEAQLADHNREADAWQTRARRLRAWYDGAAAIRPDGGATMTSMDSIPMSRADFGPLGEGTPGFVSRRRAWLHRVLATQEAEQPSEVREAA